MIAKACPRNIPVHIHSFKVILGLLFLHHLSLWASALGLMEAQFLLVTCSPFSLLTWRASTRPSLSLLALRQWAVAELPMTFTPSFSSWSWVCIRVSAREPPSGQGLRLGGLCLRLVASLCHLGPSPSSLGLRLWRGRGRRPPARSLQIICHTFHLVSLC